MQQLIPFSHTWQLPLMELHPWIPNQAESFLQQQQAKICDVCRSKSCPCWHCEILYSHGKDSDNHETATRLLQFRHWLTVIQETFFLPLPVPQMEPCLQAWYHIYNQLYYLTSCSCKQMNGLPIAFDGEVTSFKQTIAWATKSLKAGRQNKGSQFPTKF